MASRKNDTMLMRNIEGSFNYYDGHKCLGTANDKALAARLGGHSYNIINNTARDEVYLKELRHADHFLDKKGRHTVHFFGSRRRKFADDERKLIGDCLTMQSEHPRNTLIAQRRSEIQLAQMENPRSFGAFKERAESLMPSPGPKRYTVNNKRYANETEKLHHKETNKMEWNQRRGQVMDHSASAPSLSLTAPRESLDRALRSDTRKEASQRQTESAHFAPWMSANTLSSSLDATRLGREHASNQQYLSVARLENNDFSVLRKNNHYSSQDKLTRSDPFFMRPRLGITNNSVKYDIVSNERRWFRY